MVDEVGQLAALVDVITRRADGLGERPRSATEHADLGYLAGEKRRQASQCGRLADEPL